MKIFGVALSVLLLLTGMNVSAQEQEKPKDIYEQAEEEDNTLQWVEKFEKVGDNIPGLFMIDAMLGKRED